MKATITIKQYDNGISLEWVDAEGATEAGMTTPPEYIGMTIYLGEKQFVLPLITYYFLGRVFLGSGPGACR